MNYLNFMFHYFWHFLGCMMVLGLISQTAYFFWNRFFRHISIMINGYPKDTDADGDFKIDENTKDE